MKRYLVFAYPDYYPSGGMEDFIKDFDTIEEILPWIEDRIEKHKEGVQNFFMSSNNIEVYDQEDKEYAVTGLGRKLRDKYGNFHF